MPSAETCRRTTLADGGSARFRSHADYLRSGPAWASHQSHRLDGPVYAYFGVALTMARHPIIS
jgi:hypothetical protein